MAILSASDIAAMVTALGDGATGTYTPAGGVAKTVNVDFRNEYEAAVIFGDGIESSSPIAFIATADLNGVVKNGTLVIGTVTYKIKEVQPDGEGLTLLILSRD